MEYLEVLACLIVLICVAVFNRLRGTGVIKHFGTLKIKETNIEIKFVGNHLYGLFYAALFWFVSELWYVGLVAFICYLIGESKGWGEWVGALTRWEVKDEKWLERQYLDDEGKTFPFIHQIANYFIREQTIGSLEAKLKQYNKYAILALTLRGMFWFLPMSILAVVTGLLPWYIAVCSVILIGLAFPLACYLGKLTNLNGKLWFINYSRGWENQELYYGIIHFMLFVLPVLIYI